MSDPGITSEQRAAVAIHYATQNRICLDAGAEGEICIACAEVADQIDAAVEVERQAAEERGRRRGVEERDELRALLKEWLPRQCALKPWPPIGSMLACGKCLGCRTLIALAPRDSAPTCDCGVRLGQHAAFCATVAPRDSGKVG